MRGAATIDRRQALIERQFALQEERGAGSIAAAAEALRRALPADCRSEIDRLEADLSGRDTAITPGREALVALVDAARARGGQPLAAYASFFSLRAAGRQALGGMLIGIGAQVQYLIMLLAVLVIVAGTYTVFVFPALANIYQSFGMLGEGLTEYLFGRARLIWILILLAVAFVLWARWLLARVNRQIHASEPLPERMAPWPLVGEIVRTQRRWLALQWMLSLSDAGVARAAARDAAVVRFGVAGDPDGGALEAADALGTLRQELLAQIEAQQEDVMGAALRARSVLVYGLRALVYLIVAMAVIGMYAPIFGLGALS